MCATGGERAGLAREEGGSWVEGRALGTAGASTAAVGAREGRWSRVTMLFRVDCVDCIDGQPPTLGWVTVLWRDNCVSFCVG